MEISCNTSFNRAFGLGKWFSYATPLDGTILAPAFVFLVTAGFSPELTGAFAIAQLLLGLFLHANVSWRLKWLHKNCDYSRVSSLASYQ